eukprot:UN13447
MVTSLIWRGHWAIDINIWWSTKHHLLAVMQYAIAVSLILIFRNLYLFCLLLLLNELVGYGS